MQGDTKVLYVGDRLELSDGNAIGVLDDINVVHVDRPDDVETVADRGIDCAIFDWPTTGARPVPDVLQERFPEATLIAAVRGDAVDTATATLPDEVDIALAEMVAYPKLFAQTVRSAVELAVMQRETEENVEQFHALTETISDVFVQVDASGTIASVNSTVTSVFGYDPGELIGEQVSTILLEHEEPAEGGIDERLLAGTRGGESVEVVGVDKYGRELSLEVIFYEFIADRQRSYLGVINDLTERKRRIRELQLYERMVETARDGVYVVGEEGRLVAINEAIERTTGYDRDELLGKRVSVLVERDIVSSSEFAHSVELVQELLADERDVGTFIWNVHTASGAVVPFEFHVSTFQLDHDTTGIVGICRDISQRKRREGLLEALHVEMRKLMNARTAEEVGEITVTMADEVLEFSGVAVYLFDEIEAVLRPVAFTDYIDDLFDEVPVLPMSDSLAWDAFVRAESAVYDDVRSEPGVYNPATPIRSEIIIPLGNHGILIAGSTETGSFSEEDIELTHVLATNLESALDRVERETVLREREERLSEQNQELSDLDVINSVIRDINKALVQATTRAEIEQATCSFLADVDLCRFAWLGRRDFSSDEFYPVASAGTDLDGLHSITPRREDGSVEERLVAEAVRSLSVEFERNVLKNGARQDALARRYQGIAAIPIYHNETVFEVALLYASNQRLFGTTVVEVFEELGETIGHAMNGVERRNALIGDQLVEAVFEVCDPAMPLVGLTEEIDCRIALQSMVPRSNNVLSAIFRVEGGSSRDVLETLLDDGSVSAAVLLNEAEGHSLVRLQLREPAVGLLADLGVAVRDIDARDGRCRVRTHMTLETDVRAVLEAIQRLYPRSKLASRQTFKEPGRTKTDLRNSLSSALTDRQVEVLHAAFYGGYFDWPRKHSGKELAERMDIAQPTFNQHYRAALRNLFSVLLDEGDE